jgi:hypothetical protein
MADESKDDLPVGSPTGGQVDSEVLRYARGDIRPADDDSHLSDCAYLSSLPSHMQPDQTVAGVRLLPK